MSESLAARSPCFGERPRPSSRTFVDRITIGDLRRRGPRQRSARPCERTVASGYAQEVGHRISKGRSISRAQPGAPGLKASVCRRGISFTSEWAGLTRLREEAAVGAERRSPEDLRSDANDQIRGGRSG